VTLYQQLQNPALTRGLAHPLRAQMLALLLEREASPKEMAEEFGIPLANVAYHVQVLRKLKLIRLVRKTPRRGAVEHHYKAEQPPNISEAAWGEIPGAVKQGVVASSLQEIARDVTDAAAGGGFDEGDSRVSHSKLVLDQQAWDELAGLIKGALDRSVELEKEAAKRLRKSGRAGKRTAGLVMLLFDAEASGSPASGKGRGSRAGKSRRTKSGAAA
jgi:DNA-binding transcriptional ArsR family regulator